ncbi:hypothetical protein ACIQZI_13315 [Peribacillus sp. NPDC096379]|uniref:hypothetical protein n=1 Tax=Peribacillus sp. NPDC096379 TaxID=3364393 RepID=UPI003830FB99
MTLKINRLIIKIETTDGMFGTDMLFNRGLNVLRAENSSGKSTCVNSIIYALGLEGMLTSKHEVPLPYVVKDKLEYEKDVYTEVFKSSVYLEIENDKKDVITLKRDVKGGNDIHLITVYESSYSSDLNLQQSRDYFVRQSGSATRERGFHKMLVEFLSWELPEVTKYNGALTSLYVECIFPLMIVEQKRGWSGIQSNTPKQFSIKEVEKRALEFLLDLDSYSLTLKREKLISELQELKNGWKNKIKEVESLPKRINGKVVNLPLNLDEKTTLEKTQILVYANNKALKLTEVLKTEIEELKKINARDLQTVEENRKELLKSLNHYEEEYYRLEQVSQESIQKYELEQKYLVTVNKRIDATIEDLRKYKDIEKIQKLGSLDEMEFNTGLCPTCHQKVEDSLLKQHSNSNPMSIKDNIKFLEEQKKTFEFIKNNSERKLEENSSQLKTLRDEIERAREKIRSIKSNLLLPENHLNEDLIRERVILKEKIKFKQEIMNDFELVMGGFENIKEEFTLVNKQLKEIPDNLLSKKDKQKLRILEKKFKEHVSAYGLSSVDTSSLYISFDTYKPMLDGFDLESNLSASDLIRTIWAYYISLTEVEGTNHLNLLILDEPKQQSADKMSFNNLLKEYSKIKNTQVIFATSESEKDIKPVLDKIKCKLINVSEGKIFKRID